MASEAITFSVKPPARTLQAVPASSSNGQSQWLVGTTALREENELRLLQHDAPNEALTTVAAWVHPAEVWDAACCPGHPDRLLTVHSTDGVFGATLWQAEAASAALAPLAQLPHDGVIRRAVWSPHSPNTLLTVEGTALRLWDLAASPPTARSFTTPGTAAAAAGQQQQHHFWTAALHPKDPCLALAAAGSSVQLWDLRDGSSSSSSSSSGGGGQPAAVVPCGRGAPVRDVSWAPHNEHRFVSGGDDGKLRFWDTRLLAKPEALLELPGHTHWVWRCAYSPFYDQLLLSSSTDTSVGMWFTPQLAKAGGQQQLEGQKQAAGRQAGGAGRPEAADGKAHTYDEHEDSVYGLAWSATDPWLFASMSYDGRLVVNRVPKGIKYKVLI